MYTPPTHASKREGTYIRPPTPESTARMKETARKTRPILPTPPDTTSAVYGEVSRWQGEAPNQPKQNDQSLTSLRILAMKNNAWKTSQSEKPEVTNPS